MKKKQAVAFVSLVFLAGCTSWKGFAYYRGPLPIRHETPDHPILTMREWICREYPKIARSPLIHRSTEASLEDEYSVYVISRMFLLDRELAFKPRVTERKLPPLVPVIEPRPVAEETPF